MKADTLRVQIPPPGADQPSWVRVGVIAAVGFVIGVGWPRLVGARLGPSLPTEVAASTPSGARAELAPPVATATQPPSVAATPSASAAPATGGIPAMTVNHGVLLSCRDDDGQTLKGVTACGGLSGFDAIAQPRLRKLAMCPAASSATSGKLSVVFNLDFSSHRVAADVGRSSTVGDSEGFGACVKSAFQGVSLGALDHQNPRYTIAYNVLFSPGDQHTAPPADTSPSIPSSGGIPVASVTPTSARLGADDSNVEVAWEVAIVRDAPRTGQVVARLPRGTKVHLGQGQDGWYKIQYGAGNTSEGWVYRGAVAR